MSHFFSVLPIPSQATTKNFLYEKEGEGMNKQWAIIVVIAISHVIRVYIVLSVLLLSSAELVRLSVRESLKQNFLLITH